MINRTSFTALSNLKKSRKSRISTLLSIDGYRPQKESKTEMEFSSVQYNIKLSSDIFAERYCEDPLRRQ